VALLFDDVEPGVGVADEDELVIVAVDVVDIDVVCISMVCVRLCVFGCVLGGVYEPRFVENRVLSSLGDRYIF